VNTSQLKDGSLEKLGKYKIESILGKGAMGVVYKAKDPFMERTVAIKTLRTELVDNDDVNNILSRFRGEAKAYGRLLHPNIVTCYAYDEEGDNRFIVMEYVEGRSLKEYFEDNIHFPLSQVIKIMCQLLDALNYSHAHGVIHRDIKPANIMLMDNGQVKVTDFGIARLDTSNLTQTGLVIGSPNYMSPEQFSGHEVDQRTDLFSAGVILYQLLTGVKPFQGTDLVSALHNVMHVEPKVPSELNPEISPQLDEVVQKALQKDRNKRFATANDFKAALLKALEEAEAQANADLEQTALYQEEAQQPAAEQTVAGFEEDESVDQNAAPEVNIVRSTGSGAATGRKTLPKPVWAASISTLIIFTALIWQMLINKNQPHPPPLPPKSATQNINMEQVDQVIKGYDCSNLWASLDPDNSITLNGYVSHEEDIAKVIKAVNRVQGVQKVSATIETYVWPYCELLQVLSPYSQTVGNKNYGLQLLPHDHSFQYTAGENLILDVTSPDFNAYVYIDYYQLDGGVVHLFPNSSSSSKQIQPNFQFTIGDPNAGSQSWTVSPPFGREMIVIMASTKPLFGGAARPEVESAKEYLSSIDKELSVRSNNQLTADYIIINTNSNK
jgi:tRNA A-37 threonylcarbamoyl transferase component Bud32